MDKSLKGYHQYVTCATRMHETLDRCYGPVPGAYRSLPQTPLGSADQNIILLASAYIPVVKRVEREGLSRTMAPPSHFTEWCDSALLELKVSKTKEMVIDFRRKPPRMDPVVIHEVDVMDQYRKPDVR
ncbi:hypothetical protein AAFF_G00205200 [Aldrovandia affinis]|uniref:Uncharacterized protein n=1 Tax=Aldrovandia affinis TaxID=143900 RepID=A0AAD7W5D9_9TELE|nr:hypothetical protein AAFF_G00205200 [Aldrovandia affinis]